MNNLSFWRWPEDATPSFWSVFLTALLVVSAYVGFGQLPLTWALYDEFGSSLGYLSIGQMASTLGKNFFLTLIMLPFILCLVAAAFGIRYIHKLPLGWFFNGEKDFKLDFKRIGFAAVLTILVMGIGLFYELGTGHSLEWNFKGESFWLLLLISLTLIPLQTTCEELLFRSYLFKLLSTSFRPLISILLTGILFGCMHLSNPEIDVLGKEAVLFYIWSGIFMGIMTHLDNRLELAIGYHAMNNIFASILVTNSWQAFQTDALFLDTSPPEIGLDFYLTLFLWQPIILVIFGRSYKWKWSRLWNDN